MYQILYVDTLKKLRSCDCSEDEDQKRKKALRESDEQDPARQGHTLGLVVSHFRGRLPSRVSRRITRGEKDKV